MLEPIRKAFAKENGVKPALFSANSEGACPNCNGAGVVYTELGFMDTIATTCEECEGRRFQAAVLEYRLGGKNIHEVLEMAIHHRVGPVEIGETSVVIAVSAPHRAAAFDACREAIDTLKRTVPLWKKELYVGGEEWIGQGS